MIAMSGLLPTQYDFIQSKVSHPLYLGGYGSGKTTADVYKCLQLMDYNRGLLGVFGMPRRQDIEDIFVPKLNEICDKHDIPYNYRGGAFPNFKIKFKSGHVSTCRLLTLWQPERIVGFDCAWFGVDEIDTLPARKAELAWDNLLGRMRLRGFNQGFASTTPEGYRFAYKLWQKEPARGYRIYRAQTAENTYLPEGYIDRMMERYDSERVKAYLNAEFVNLGGRIVWTFFSREKHVSEFELSRTAPHYSFWDFGYDHPNYTGLAFVQDGHVYVYDEVQVRHHYIQDIIDIYKSRLAHHNVSPVFDYCDPSGNQSRESQLETNIRVMRANGMRPKWNVAGIGNGIQIGNNLFDKGRVTIHPRCTGLIHSLESWQRKEDANGISVGYEEEFKDPSDAFRYLLYGLFLREKKEMMYKYVG